MNLEELIARDPKLHRGGKSWKLHDNVLRYIDRRIGDGAHTLETGCGLSTIMFAFKGCHHVCVSPDRFAVEKITEFCDEAGISLERIRFEVAPSERVLPGLALDPLDLVLIDGSHSFPGVFIDWYYTAPALALGGAVVIDDLQIWTGEVLRDFLKAEEEWALERDLPPRSVAFRKVAQVNPQKGWWLQRYVVEHSGPYRSSLGRSLGRALDLARRGEFATLAAKVKQRMTTR